VSGRAVLVEPERLPGWFDRFGQRHGGVASTEVAPHQVSVHAVDGATAVVAVPFGPLDAGQRHIDGLAVDELVAHLLRPRRVALLLVRLGGHSAGVAHDGTVVLSSTDRRLVHGRHKAGGSSSGRFARRREGQARVALQAAADTAARVLLPELDTVDAVVLGGDRRALDQLRADPRLTPLFARAEPTVLDLPEPRRAVLDDAARRVRCARITVTHL
jgi:Actinobacteria/chloroflexi VLRF1 release factor